MIGRASGVSRASRRRRGSWWLAALALVAAPMVSAQRTDPLAAVRTVWTQPSPDARPMMRWWWFGAAVTPEGLDRELQAMHDAGLGGVEVQPVYPLVPDDRGRGLVNHPFLSAPFLDAVRHSAATAKRLGLRYDMTLGSGWPYGGPHIPIDHAAGRLRWDKVPVTSRRVPLPPMTTGETPDRRDAAERRRRADRSPRRRRVAARGAAAGRGLGLHRRPHRHDGQARRGRRRGLRARSLRSCRTAGASRRRRRAAPGRAARHASSDDLLRQPRGVRLGLDPRPAHRVPPPPRLRPASASRRDRGRYRRAGDRRAPGLGPDPGRAVRGALPGAPGRVDARARLEAAHPGLRHPAGHAVEQPARRSHRRRRRAVEDDHAGPLGVVGQPSVRPRGHRVRDVDVAAFAVVRGDAARSQGRSRSPLPDGRESVDRARLAVHAGRRQHRQRALQLGASMPPAPSTIAIRGGSRCPTCRAT